MAHTEKPDNRSKFAAYSQMAHLYEVSSREEVAARDWHVGATAGAGASDPSKHVITLPKSDREPVDIYSGEVHGCLQGCSSVVLIRQLGKLWRRTLDSASDDKHNCHCPTTSAEKGFSASACACLNSSPEKKSGDAATPRDGGLFFKVDPAE